MIWGKIYIVFNYLVNVFFAIIFASFISVMFATGDLDVDLRGVFLAFFVAMALGFNLYFVINTQGLFFQKRELENDLIDDDVVKVSKKFKGYRWVWIMPIVTNFTLLFFLFSILKNELNFESSAYFDYFPWLIISAMSVLAISTVFYSVSCWQRLKNEE